MGRNKQRKEDSTRLVFTNSKATTKAAMLVALGEIDAAREILNDDLRASLSSILSKSSFDYDSIAEWKSAIKDEWSKELTKKKSIYSNMGIEIPEKYLNFDFDVFFKAVRRIPQTHETQQSQPVQPFIPPSFM